MVTNLGHMKDIEGPLISYGLVHQQQNWQRAAVHCHG